MRVPLEQCNVSTHLSTAHGASVGRHREGRHPRRHPARSRDARTVAVEGTNGNDDTPRSAPLRVVDAPQTSKHAPPSVAIFEEDRAQRRRFQAVPLATSSSCSTKLTHGFVAGHVAVESGMPSMPGTKAEVEEFGSHLVITLSSPDILIPVVSHFVLSGIPHTSRVVQLSLTSASELFHLCVSPSLWPHRFLFEEISHLIVELLCIERVNTSARKNSTYRSTQVREKLQNLPQ
ncbi:hypothetical protein BHE74_00015046 [Ensete ventricosum]|nr:hypothetical protein BHE74_00015046 [Ensete ventricosum]